MRKTEAIELTQPTYRKKAVKPNETSILLMIIGILALAVIGLSMAYSRQVNEQNQVNKELTLTESRLKQIQLKQTSSRKAALEQQLAQTTGQFQAANAILSQPIQSFAVTTVVFDIAKECALEITKMTLADRTSAKLGEIPCSVMSLKVGVEGDMGNLVSFVTALNSSFAAGVVESITVSIPEMDSGKKASADMVLSIYSRQER